MQPGHESFSVQRCPSVRWPLQHTVVFSAIHIASAAARSHSFGCTAGSQANSHHITCLHCSKELLKEVEKGKNLKVRPLIVDGNVLLHPSACECGSTVLSHIADKLCVHLLLFLFQLQHASKPKEGLSEAQKAAYLEEKKGELNQL